MLTNLEQLFKEKYADENDHQWHYSLSSTSLKSSTILLIGFNWGASNSDNYLPQPDLPSYSFKELYERGELGSFS